MFYIIVGLLIGLIFYSLFILPTCWLKVERIENDLGIGKKVVQISDIHIKNMRVSNKVIEKILKEEKPDYLFLTGDFVDRSEEEFEKLVEFIRVIKDSGIEAYAVLGNHDRYIDERVLIELLGKYNITVLRNDFVVKEGFTLVGIDDFCKGKHDIEKAFSFKKEMNDKIIVITHDPNVVDHINKDYNYLLAGHLHGKQINIPFLFKISNRGRLPSRGIYKGKHLIDGKTIYISKGIGQSKWNIRFMVRSELTIHNI